MRKLVGLVVSVFGAVVLLVAAAGAAAVHADSSQATDACLDGRTTVIVGLQCAPGTPSVAKVCATGAAHLTIGPVDYCPSPRVVTVGEAELGTEFVPRLFDGTRLDVAMRRTSLASMRFRCARLGGSHLAKQHGFYVCHGVAAR